MTDDGGTVELDRSGPVWTGRFPGLGEVRIDPDGELTVRCESDDPGAADALRHGWGELLALARRGVSILSGASVAPAPGAPALLLTGQVQHTGTMTAALAGLGWTVVSDRVTPVDLDGPEILVLPRPVPVLAPRALVADDAPVPARPARADTDALLTEITTSPAPHPLAGLVQLRQRRIGEPEQRELVGQERFAHASSLHVLGALRPFRPDEEGGQGEDGTGTHHLLIADHLRLAELPALSIQVGHDEDAAVEQVVSWFTTALEQ